SWLASLVPVQRHVVAVDELVAARRAEDRGDLATLLTDDTLRVHLSIGNEAATQLAPVGGADDNGIAPVERAFDARPARRQQTLARTQRLLRAGVDVDVALGLELPGDPALLGGERVGRREEPGARRAVGDRAQRVLHLAAGDDHVRAGAERDLRR